MKVVHNVSVVTVLELTPDEAAWLRAVMQNPITCHGVGATESSYDKEMRRRFFDAITVPTMPSQG